MSEKSKQAVFDQQAKMFKIYQKKRFLVVDDFTEVRAAYKRMLRSFGVREIDTAASGDEAMERCAERDYGIIICDYNLDQSKDGQQVLEELRHIGSLKFTSLFIIVTAESTREMVLGAIENQPDDYITKPISQQLMRSRLDRALLKHQYLFKIKHAMDEKNYELAIERCDKKIAANTRYTMDCIRYKAQILNMMNKHQVAKVIYEEVLQEKDLSWATVGLAKSMLHLGETEGLEELLITLLEKDERYIEAYDLLSDFYEEAGQFEKAQLAIEKATELSPKSIQRHRRLAKLAEHNNDEVTCIKAYEEAIRWNYNSCHASSEDYLSLSRKTVEVIQGSSNKETIEKAKKAIGLLDRMKKRFPDNVNRAKGLFIEAELYNHQGKTSLAKASLASAEKIYHEIETKDVDLRLDFSRSEITLGDKETGHIELRQLAEEYHDDEALLEKIDKISDEPISKSGKASAAKLSKSGIVAYQNKNYDQAIDIFNYALTMFPNHVGVNLNLVQVILAKIGSDGVTKDLHEASKKCLASVGELQEEHPQYARYQFLSEQYQQLLAS